MKNTLWNHSLVGSYPARELQGIPGVWRYSARILPSTAPGDIVQLDSDLKDQYPIICDHYRLVNLDHATEIVWSNDLEIAKSYPDHDWNIFLFSEQHNEIKPDERWKTIVSQMNDKNYFIRLCQSNNWAVPETVCFDCPSDLTETASIRFPCYLKVGCSASGAGVFYCKDSAELLSKVSGLDKAVDFQIQQPVTNAVFLNVQYDVKDGRANRLIYTEQVLDGFSHAGNKYPSNFGKQPWKLCDPLAAYMVRRGMQGPFAFDVAAADGKLFLIECNPRFNGCTYYSQVAKKIKANYWVARNLTVREECLSKLSLDGLTWNPNEKKGIIIVSWGTILQRKVGVLFAGNSDQECDVLYDEFMRRNGN